MNLSVGFFPKTFKRQLWKIFIVLQRVARNTLIRVRPFKVTTGLIYVDSTLRICLIREVSQNTCYIHCLLEGRQLCIKLFHMDICQLEPSSGALRNFDWTKKKTIHCRELVS